MSLSSFDVDLEGPDLLLRLVLGLDDLLLTEFDALALVFGLVEARSSRSTSRWASRML